MLYTSESYIKSVLSNDRHFLYCFENYLGNVSIQLNTSSGTRPALREVI